MKNSQPLIDIISHLNGMLVMDLECIRKLMKKRIFVVKASIDHGENGTVILPVIGTTISILNVLETLFTIASEETVQINTLSSDGNLISFLPSGKGNTVIRVDDVVDALNLWLERDRGAVMSAVNARVDCSTTMEIHPHVQVQRTPDGLAALGLLGVLNGVFHAGQSMVNRVEEYIIAKYDENHQIRKFHRIGMYPVEELTGRA